MPNFAALHARVNAAVQVHLANAVLTFASVPVDVVFKADDDLLDSQGGHGRMQQAPRQWQASAPAVAFTAGLPARGDLVDIDGDAWRVTVADVSLTGMAKLTLAKAAPAP